MSLDPTVALKRHYVIRATNSAADFASISAQYSVYPHLGITSEFSSDYVAQYKNDYQIAYAGNAYDMAMTWGRLFNNLSAAISADEIMVKLKSVKNQSGIGGIFSFIDSSVDGPHYHFPVQLKRISGESIEPLALEDQK